MAKLLLQKQSHLCMNLIFFCSAISLGLPEVLKKKKKTKMWGEARYLHPIDYCLYLWCTKRVKSTDTGRPLFQKSGRPVNIRVDSYCTSLLAFTGRTVKYESTYNLRGRPLLYMGRPVFSLKETDRSEDGFIGFSAPLKYAVKSHNCNLFGSFDMANVLFVLLETCTVNTGLQQHNFIFS